MVQVETQAGLHLTGQAIEDPAGTPAELLEEPAAPAAEKVRFGGLRLMARAGWCPSWPGI